MKEISLNHKLAQIQTKFKSKKSRFNKFGKYYYRSAEDIQEALKPFLLEYDVTVKLKEKYLGNNIIKSTAIISDGIQKIKASAIVGVEIEQKGQLMPQRFGATSSFGKKYALGNLFLIDDTEDADTINKRVKLEKNGLSFDTVKDKFYFDNDVENFLKQKINE